MARVMKYLAYVFASLSIFSSVALGNDALFTTKSATPLVPTESENPEIAKFAGQATISGDYLVSWEFRDDEPYQLLFTLIPDAESRAILPHIANGKEVEELNLDDPKKIVQLLFDANTANDILSRKILSARGKATVVIEDYFTAVDCDQRSYVARVVNVVKHGKVVLADKKVQSRKC
ncbi:MAG TPA: hypothetical protein VFK88_12250 [Gallionella sp.]|nr:hypothetical protein [Gallionella sp.]